MIEEYHRKREELDAMYEREKQVMLDSGEKMFKVENWVPQSKKDSSDLVEVSPIDAMERDFFQEYEKVMTKDKETKKDFNLQAFNYMKQTKYYFEYIRTQEKLYKLEL